MCEKRKPEPLTPRLIPSGAQEPGACAVHLVKVGLCSHSEAIMWHYRPFCLAASLSLPRLLTSSKSCGDVSFVYVVNRPLSRSSIPF